MRRCVAALGCTASQENAVPNGGGLALHGWPIRGNGRTAVGTRCSESSVGFGFRYAQPRAVAAPEIWALNAVTAVTIFTSSDGTTTRATVSAQSRLRGAQPGLRRVTRRRTGMARAPSRRALRV